MNPCFCVGPAPGETLCPCQKRARANEDAVTFAPSCHREPMTSVQSGWACPKCGNVYAPRVSECRKCNKTGGLRERIGP